MFRSRLFWKLFLAYSLSMAVLVIAALLLNNTLASTESPWLGSPWFFALIVALLIIGVGLMITRQLTAPLVRLAAVSQPLLKQPPRPEDQDEVRTLAQVIDALHSELTHQVSRQDQERDLSRAVLGCMVESVLVLDAEERVQFLNSAAARLLKLNPAIATGKKLWELVRVRSLSEAFEAVMSGTQPFNTEMELEYPERRSLKIQGTPLVGAGRRGAVLVLEDVTDIRRLERVRQDFFTNVSHELKTPLAAIGATVETLVDGALHDPKYNVNFLNRISENVTRLTRLVNDLLALSRIESGQQPLHPEPLELEPIVQNCLHRLEHRARLRQQTIQLNPGPTPVLALADQHALDQILDNLVDNAIKYTPEGGVISLFIRTEDNHALIEILDNGIGMSRQDLPRIFERFFRADRARDRQDEGTGLGLSIVKHLVQAHGGRIDVESNIGQGSAFKVMLPLPPQL